MTARPARRVAHLALLGLASALAFPSLLAEGPDVRGKLVVPATAVAGSKVPVAVELAIGGRWHVNSHTPSEDFLIPTDVALKATGATLSPVRYPKHLERKFGFYEKPLRVYAGTVRFETDLELPASATGAVPIAGTLSYQACNDQQCFAPAEIPLAATVSVSLPARPAK